MAQRWRILAVLFLARATMGVQFQTIATLSPLLMERYGVGLGEIGLLIGLYVAPGVALALPGGALGRRWGDSRVVAFGMVLMTAGGALAALAPVWEAQLAGRLVAGAGGVLLNVLMSKMAADWFAGRELATAMAIFVNSWPVGIALGLVALPAVAAEAGAQAALGAAAGLVAAGLVLFAGLYRSPPGARAGGGAVVAAAPLTGAPLAGALISGAIWALYNAALGMVFGFGPAMLAARGWSVAEAAWATSLTLWAAAAAIPFGGLAADRLGARDGVIAVGLGGFAAALVLAADTALVAPAFLLAGLVGGVAAGPIMSLPAAVLPPAMRATGIGAFFTLYYVGMMAAPPAAGALADALARPEAPLLFGAALLAAALGLLAAFRAIEAGAARPAA